MSTSNKVGELFKAAGQSLTLLGELTTQLHPTAEPTPVNSKWTDVEIDMMLKSVKRFCTDLNTISETIKTRTITQIRNQMKRKAYEEVGLSPPPAPLVITSPTPPVPHNTLQIPLHPSIKSQIHLPGATDPNGQTNNDMTLSALNAAGTDSDPDLDPVITSRQAQQVVLLSSETGGRNSAKKMKLDIDPADQVDVV